MGQFALGLRSLAIKIAIFVVLAALLAWSLGGTLFPRAETTDGPAVTWRGATWWLRLAVGGEHRGEARWSLQRQEGKDKPTPWSLPGIERWADAAGLVATREHLYVAFRANDAPEWTWAVISAEGVEATNFPDRLEIERQLARVRAGLPPQTPADASADRAAVIRAASERGAAEKTPSTASGS